MNLLWIVGAFGTQLVLRMNDIHTSLLVFKYSSTERRTLVDQGKDGETNNTYDYGKDLD
jgi:hypothetical protein